MLVNNLLTVYDVSDSVATVVVITYATVAPEAFRGFGEPGYAKTVYS